MIKYAAAIAALWVTPVLSQECMDANKALEAMSSNGYEITFGDKSGEWSVFMAEDGNGRWVLFAVKDDALCPIAAGSNGTHAPVKPNA